MNIVYYISSVLLFLAFIGLPIVTIYFLVKPHAFGKVTRTTRTFSRPKIFLIGLLAFVLSIFSFSGIMAATEPESVRLRREAEQAAVLKAQQEKEAKEKAEAEKKREEERKKPVVKRETKTEAVSYESIEEKDATLPRGETRVTTEGAEGTRTYTYEVTYVEGKETKRKELKNEVTKAPIAKVTKIGTYVAPPAPTPVPAPAPAPTPPPQSHVYYRNCTAARAAGAAPVYAGEPGYARHLDRDGDGIGCE